MGEPFALRARVVVPVRRTPIEDGAVIVASGKILDVGRWRDIHSRFSGPVHDLGDTALLPGLINAHCHLDYTQMAGLFPPSNSFCDWIKLITTEKAQWTFSDFAKSWLDGAKMLLNTGTTTVADIEAVPELLPDVWNATPLRVFSFLEMTGVRSRRDPNAILADAAKTIRSLPVDRCRAALSPHAPYSTTPALLQKAAALARKKGWRLMTHVSESATEFEMFMRGTGEMFTWIARNERDMSDCGDCSPIARLDAVGLLSRNLIATHANYLAPGDAELLARCHVSVVHCPRSHDYFSHKPFQHRALTKAGVNVSLGTDSLATVRKARRANVKLDMFAEMQMFARKNPTVKPRQILRLATINGARALSLAGKIGEISSGSHADLVALPFSGKMADIYERIVHHAGEVTASMIGGEWAIQPAH